MEEETITTTTTTSPQCPYTVTVRRNPQRRARPTPSTTTTTTHHHKPKDNNIPSFPLNDILSIDITKQPQQQPLRSENLKVYLRIKPLKASVSDQSLVKSRLLKKNAWPQKPNAKEKNAAKKKRNVDVCVSVNDDHSVTLSPPAALQESKKIKSEIYEGFAHVFSQDSSQGELYEKMVKPLVKEFLDGNNGMLAALGPSGSGKTYTVFGTAREPGMVPLALQHIFKQVEVNDRFRLSRSFSISMFEICSEKSKVERICDLSPDGAELVMQQSAIKGLQEIPISDAAHAETLIASAMLKRLTATTNTNSQSSRSQCIINIHCALTRLDGEEDVEPNNSVLTIVDLAGAERERRTGNQGVRLLESNFINNTSMVFGLCLRSLLEHQKNPKKPLQKHFQNSLLTRYLRDYLEGKKRMTLILTVRPGEEDYLDTSYLLRQASPYMKIKFDKVEEPSNATRNKRPIQLFPMAEQPKRMKYSGLESDKSKDGKRKGSNQTCELDLVDRTTPAKSDSVDLTRDRSHWIMKNFAKAIWSVLKEYNEKLKVAEKEIQSLQGNLRFEKRRNNLLEKELADSKAFCIHSKKHVVDTDLVNLDPEFGDPLSLDMPTYSYASEELSTGSAKESKCKDYSIKDNSITVHDNDAVLKMAANGNKILGMRLSEEMKYLVPIRESEVSVSSGVCSEKTTTVSLESTESRNIHECYDSPTTSEVNPGHDRDILPEITPEKYKSIPEEDEEVISEVDVSAPSFSGEASQRNLIPGKCGFSSSSHDPIADEVDSGVLSPTHKASDNKAILENLNPSPESRKGVIAEVAGNSPSLVFKVSEESIIARNCGFSSESNEDLISEESDCKATLSPSHNRDVQTSQQLDPPMAKKGFAMSKKHIVEVQDSETASNMSCKPMNVEKPRRRLLPASSILLRDITALGIDDDNDKPKGNRSAKKVVALDKQRTQGSLSLFRLLQSNLRV